ncbi:hypothetical protein ACGF8B_35685 [Streptomyces sp. NPDC047917]|uniref:hypothetical protein n=1 Tax=Streptomyces sp. NPDC047917 TaxID=3365491 RepID=UPI00371656E7
MAIPALAGVASLGTFFVIHPLAVALPEDEPDESKAWWIVGFAALALAVRFVAQSLSYPLTHDADIAGTVAARKRTVMPCVSTGRSRCREWPQSASPAYPPE